MDVRSKQGIGIADRLAADLRLHRSDSAHVEPLTRHLVLHRRLLLVLGTGCRHNLPRGRCLLRRWAHHRCRSRGMRRMLLSLLGGLHSRMLLEAVLKLSWSHAGSRSRRSHLLNAWTSGHGHGSRLWRMSGVLLRLHAARSGRAREGLVLKVRRRGNVVSGGGVLRLDGGSGLSHTLLLLLLKLLLLSSGCRLSLLDLVRGHGLLVELMPLQHLVLLDLRLRRLLLLNLLSMSLAQTDDAHSLGSDDLSVRSLGVLRHRDGHSRRAGLTGLHEVGSLGVS